MTTPDDVDDLLGPVDPIAALHVWQDVDMNLGDPLSPADQAVIGADDALLDPSGADLLEGPLHDANYNGIADPFEH
jgi:hypothetical protein